MNISKSSMFNLPNLLTAMNLLSGSLAILFALQGYLDLSCFLILAAMVFDFFDGFAARKLGISGELGKQLDSLADMVTFGLAPAMLCFIVLVFSTFQAEFTLFTANAEVPSNEIVHRVLSQFFSTLFNAPEATTFIPFSALLIVFLSLFRLAKFNIDTRQSERFLGLPTPANTLFFLTFPLLIETQLSANGVISPLLIQIIQPAVFVPLILIFSLLLVSEIPLIALKFKDFTWRNNVFRYLLIGSVLILIPLFLIWSIPIIIILYLVLSILENTLA